MFDSVEVFFKLVLSRIELKNLHHNNSETARLLSTASIEVLAHRLD